MSVIATCPGCGTKNRLKPAPRLRCGSCKREFTPAEVATAAGFNVVTPRPDEPDLEDDEDDY